MKLIFSCFVLLTGVFFSAGSGFAQTGQTNTDFDKELTLLRKDIRSEKKQLLALNLTLTEAEATKFWPVYDQYSAELEKIYNERAALIKEYAANYTKLTDQAAESLTKRSLDNDTAISKLRQKYQPIVAKVLPGKRAALFFQIEKRLSMLIDLKMATEIPVVTQ